MAIGAAAAVTSSPAQRWRSGFLSSPASVPDAAARSRLVISGIATFRAAGSEWVSLWPGAWIAAWAVAFPVVLVAAPLARRLVRRLVAAW